MAESSRLTQDLGLTHSLAKMFADQEAIARQYALNPAFKDRLSWKETSALSSVLETLRGHDLLPRVAIGPLADLKHLCLLSASPDALRGFGFDPGLIAGFEAKFRLPDALEAARIAGLFDTSLAAQSARIIHGRFEHTGGYGEHEIPVVRRRESFGICVSLRRDPADGHRHWEHACL